MTNDVVSRLNAEIANQKSRHGEEDSDDRVYLAMAALEEIERLQNALRGFLPAGHPAASGDGQEQVTKKHLYVKQGFLYGDGPVRNATMPEQTLGLEIERLERELRSQHAAYNAMLDKAAALERRNAVEPKPPQFSEVERLRAGIQRALNSYSTQTAHSLRADLHALLQNNPQEKL